MSRKHKLLIVLLSAVLAGNIGLVAMNLATAREGMIAAQSERLRALREGFDIALYAAETKLTEIAAFSIQTEDVRAMLTDALATLEQAGGDQHAPLVEERRRQLADLIGRRWTRLQFHYMLRQFGFYLPPDLAAFYRAEAPHRYGEATETGALAKQVAATGKPAAGFALDALTTGVRAAVPVDLGGRAAVVEVGTAFDPILAPICPNSHCGVAVLLPSAAVADDMNTYDMDAQFTDNRRIGDWLVEASTNPAVTRALLAPERQALSVGSVGRPVQVGARWFATMSFPLRDFLGKDDPDRPAVGQVLIWLSVDEAMKALEQAKIRNIIGAVAGFLIVSLLIYLLVQLATSKLEAEIRRRTSEVQSLLEEVSFLAERDPLTGLYNRRIFTQRLHQELARARRTGEPFSIVSIDLDHFKLINDRYGHPTGDQVLCLVGTLIRDGVRAEDAPARVGGEEFALLLPHTDAAGAAVLAERLRAELAAAPVLIGAEEYLRPTFSAGVTAWTADADEDSLLRAVDRALYVAKATGRDRVVIADSLSDAPAG
jgi:diguanylate cyclase (GGDEF)-like protein